MEAVRETLNVENDPDRRPEYDRLRNALGGVETKVSFLISMMYGFQNRSRMPLKKKISYVRISYLNEEDRCLVAAVALESGLTEDTFSWNEAFEIAEEYARGGIALLRNRLEDIHEFENSFPLEILAQSPESVATNEA